ncbi:hypothetical protein [Cohnella sp. GCM10027633]|uniref:hypothetical protein n=1 Tax=unclassified Cohnella TaxID=2636738 RepID=UPI00364335D4
MIIVVSLALGAALCCVLLSFVPWVQENMQWMTSYKFYVLVGAIVGSALVLVVKRVGELATKAYGG